MNVSLFPRLSNLAVHRTLQELQSKIDTSSAQAFINNSPGKSYGASGGSRIEEKILSELCETITTIASKHGFPNRTTKKSRSNFDNDVCIAFSSLKELRSGELLRSDTWAFITTALLPTVVIWRFKLDLDGDLSNAVLSRFCGGVRNTFQRLWVRSEIFDRGAEHPHRWDLLRSLPEDAMVQITERASLAAIKSIAVTIAEEWLTSKNQQNNSNISSEDLMRQAVILIRLQNEITELSTQSSATLKKIISKKFTQAAFLIRSSNQ